VSSGNLRGSYLDAGSGQSADLLVEDGTHVLGHGGRVLGNDVDDDATPRPE
jgi:hypothetical protein